MGCKTLYKPEYCDLLVQFGDEGKGIMEFCAHVGVVRQTLHDWRAVHPEFQEAYDRHKVNLQAWWERAGREGMFMQSFNATVWTKNMNNRFRDEWGEKVDVGLSGGFEVKQVKRLIVDPKAG